MKVKAAPGIKAPFHHRPQDYIPEGRFVEVPDDHYYRAMLADGDLVEATPEEWAAQQKADEEAVAAEEKSRAKAAREAAKASQPQE